MAGGVDAGESVEAAGLRELEEETSITNVRIVGSVDRWLCYDFPPAVKAKLSRSWQHYDGQAQKWLLMHFYGSDDEVNICTEHREFKEWRWMPLEEVVASVVDFKRDLYEQVAAEFMPLILELKESGALSAPAPMPASVSFSKQ